MFSGNDLLDFDSPLKGMGVLVPLIERVSVPSVEVTDTS
jgi:hypothetical protein